MDSASLLSRESTTLSFANPQKGHFMLLEEPLCIVTGERSGQARRDPLKCFRNWQMQVCYELTVRLKRWTRERRYWPLLRGDSLPKACAGKGAHGVQKPGRRDCTP